MNCLSFLSLRISLFPHNSRRMQNSRLIVLFLKHFKDVVPLSSRFYIMQYFFLSAFKTFSLLLIFSSLFIMCLVWFSLSLFCNLMCFTKSESFQPLFSQTFFFGVKLFPSLSGIATTDMLYIKILSHPHLMICSWFRIFLSQFCTLISIDQSPNSLLQFNSAIKPIQ